jgi:hypothetical protein
MILATVLTLCASALPCNDYIIDTATNSRDASINLVAHSQEFKRVWTDGKLLSETLALYNIVEEITEVQTYELNTRSIDEDDMP